MRYYLLAATAAAAIVATPAAARDNSGYVGLDAGVTWPRSQTVFGSVDFTDPAVADITRTSVADYRFKMGYDIDVVGGYDFGMFRVEGELGYKHAKVKDVRFDSSFITALNAGAGTAFTTGTTFNLNDHASVFSAMLNGLLDVGGETGIGGYAGAGVGYANVKEFGDSNGKFAWQLLAGVYMPVSDNVDVGLKYRYFNAGRTDRSDSFAFAGVGGGSGGTIFFDNDSRYTSHSLLLSLVYNFAAAAPPPPPPPPSPPPPPPAPATQTCPDGSVIPADQACPAPPPPPPPPPVQRGERGK